MAPLYSKAVRSGWPIIVFVLIAFYIILLFSFVGKGANWWVQLNILLSGFSFFFSITLVLGGAVLFAKGEMGKQGAKRWGAFALFVLSPSLIFTIGRLDMSLISIAVQILVIVFLSFNKRPPEIIRA